MTQSKKIERKYIGSITVETSYISVFVIFILILLLYIGFYYHDRSIAGAGAGYISRMMIRSSLKWIDIDKKVISRDDEFSHILNDHWSLACNAGKETLEKKGYEWVQNRMLFSKIDQVSIECSYDQLFDCMKCKVCVDGYLEFPVSLFGHSGLGFIEVYEAKDIDAVKAIWKKEAVINGGSPDDG